MLYYVYTIYIYIMLLLFNITTISTRDYHCHYLRGNIFRISSRASRSAPRRSENNTVESTLIVMIIAESTN